MSYDIQTEGGCAWCQTGIDLNHDEYTKVGHDYLHISCAVEYGEEHGAMCHCGHAPDEHYGGDGDCIVNHCRCRQYSHATGPDPRDYDPTEADLITYNGPQ